MADKITGGEPVKKTYQVSEAEMKQVQTLLNAGVGQAGPMSAAAERAVSSLRGDGMTPGQRYQARVQTFADALNSNDPYIVEQRAASNAAFLRTIRNESPGPSDVHTDAATSELSTQYANDEFIGEMLMPPVLVPKKTNEFFTYGKSDRLQQPADDRIADQGPTPEVVETRSTGSSVSPR